MVFGSLPGAGQQDSSVPETAAVRNLIRDGEYAEAEARARALVAKLESDREASALAIARALDVLVEAIYHGSVENREELVELATRALSTKEAELGPEHLELGVSLNNLGVVYRQLERFAESQAAFERALELRERALGSEHLLVAEVLTNLATLLTEMGQYSEARLYFERDIEISERQLGPEHSDMVRKLYNYGRVLYRVGDYLDTRTQYERALGIAEKNLGSEHPGVAYILNGLANVHIVIGEYTAARDRYELALRIAEAQLGENHPLTTACVNNLGNIYRRYGDYSTARRHYERALEMAKHAHGASHSTVARVTARIADVEYAEQNYGKARELYERALDALQRAESSEGYRTATILERLAMLHFDLGQYEESRRLLDRALDAQRSYVGEDDEHVAAVLTGLALVALETGDVEGAERLAARAVEITEPRLGPDHSDLARMLQTQALAAERTGDDAAALDLALRAERITREHVRLTIRALPEREALGFSSLQPGGLDLALSIVAREADPLSTTRAWDALIRSRGLVLDEMGARRAVLGQMEDAESVRMIQEFALASRRLANLIVEGPDPHEPASYMEQVRAARDAQEQTERALAERSKSFRSMLTREQVGFADVEERLPAETGLVAFVRYERPELGRALGDGDGYLAFVLASRSAEVVPLGPASVIDTLVSAWFREAAIGVHAPGRSPEEAEAACRAAGQALGTAIWDPVAAALPATGRILVVPDGSLNLVNFASLPHRAGGYLIDHSAEFHYLSAERDLVLSVDDERRDGLFVVGGPDYDATETFAAFTPESAPAPRDEIDAAVATFRGEPPECSAFDAFRFRPLPGSREEAERLAAMWADVPGGRVIHASGPEASERVVKTRARGARVCHLATHGFFIGEHCAPTDAAARGIQGLVAGPQVDIGPLALENPLLFAGLALSGANHREAAEPTEEDGILTAEEITAMDLSGVEWAVLSACGSGLGAIRAGEGVFGLRRAFRVAGARTLILSLWSVDDTATLEWMLDLYRGRLYQSFDTFGAVSAASRSVLERRRQEGASTHPFYWAAFVAAGDWR